MISIPFVILSVLCLPIIFYFSLHSLIARNRVKQWNPKTDPIDYIHYWESEKKKWSKRKILLMILAAIFAYGSYLLDGLGL